MKPRRSCCRAVSFRMKVRNIEKGTLSASPWGEAPLCGDEGQTNKTLAFCQKRTSTFFDRKMRSRRRPRLRLTQAACYRVSSSCRQYEVFGNFAWRSAPPRKRVTQSEKAPALRDREVPPRKRRRGARLRGNGDRGTCLTEGEALLRRSAGYIFIPFQEIPRQARNDNKLSRKSACIFSACADDEWECEGNPHTPFILRLRTYTATRRRRISLQSNFITK